MRALVRALAGALALVAAGCSDPVAAGDPSERPAGEAPGAASPLDAAAPSALPAEPGARSLEAPIERIVARWCVEAEKRSRGQARASEITVAVRVQDLASGAELASLRADRALRPASNMKLVTTAAVLVLLGPAAEFVTPFEARGTLTDGVLAGDLVVRASGDPLVDPSGDARVEERLGSVARELARRGLRRVKGALVLDQRTFAEPGPAPGWPDPSQFWADYCAFAGAFTLNGGVLRADITAGTVGGDAGVEVHPSPHGLRAAYGVKTSASGKLDVRVGATRTTVTVKGEVPKKVGNYTAEFSHPDPVGLFSSVLMAKLGEAGITVDGGVRRARDVPAGTVLASLRSPVADALGPINAESRNGVADQLFLALGGTVAGEATRAGGHEATGMALARLGVPSEGLVQVDGSGLSRDNRVSAEQITALLAAVLGGDPRSARPFRESLAVMGESGTLDDRLVGEPAAGRVSAKTGWIAGASALSGVARTADGRELVFSILVEYPSKAGGLNTYCFKPMQDELVSLLVEGAP